MLKSFVSASKALKSLGQDAGHKTEGGLKYLRSNRIFIKDSKGPKQGEVHEHKISLISQTHFAAPCLALFVLDHVRCIQLAFLRCRNNGKAGDAQKKRILLNRTNFLTYRFMRDYRRLSTFRSSLVITEALVVSRTKYKKFFQEPVSITVQTNDV